MKRDIKGAIADKFIWIFLILFCLPNPVSGTGSYPPLQNGWHRNRRYMDRTNPARNPLLSKASTAYAEQVGTNRQEGCLFKPDRCFW